MKTSQARKFIDLSIFMMRMLPGRGWKLPLAALIAFLEMGILILLPLLGARIIDALNDGNGTAFKQCLIFLAVLTPAQVFFGFILRYLLLRIEEQAGNRLRRKMVESVLSEPLLFFEEHWVGDIVSRTMNDGAALKGYITKFLLQIVLDTATLIIVVFILFTMHPILATLTVMTTPVTLMLGRYAQPRLQRMTTRIRENIAALTGHLQAWLTNVTALKTFSLECRVAQQFGYKSDELMRNTINMGVWGAAVSAVNSTFLSIPMVIIFMYGGYVVLSEGPLSVGKLFAFISFSSYFNGPIQRLIGLWVTGLPMQYSIYQRIQEFLPSNAPGGPPGIRPEAGDDPVAALRVRDVLFTFGKSSDFELFIPSLNVSSGELVGVTGANGSGKSTLARLLTGLYLPDRGLISLDGKRSVSSNESDYRSCCALLPQKVELFNGSLQENVSIFDDTVDTDKLAEIERLLDLTDWLRSLPEGWETKINAGLAKSFSGGELRKLGMARLLYIDPPVLVLDEPEAGLDDNTRVLLKRIILQLKDSKLILLITHTKELLELCDHLYLLFPAEENEKRFVCTEVSIPEAPEVHHHTAETE